MTTLTGADAAELDRAAAELRAAAGHLDAQAAELTAGLHAVAWVGGVAARFVGRWASLHRRQLGAAADHLRDLAAALERHAADQRAASGASGGGGRARAAVGAVREASTDHVPVALGEVADQLAVLGIGRTAADSVASALRGLDDDVARRLVGLVTDRSFVDLMDRSADFLDVGNFVVDFFVDVADHPDLTLDERIVHGLADAAARLGLSEGIERGAEFLAASLTAAVLPVAGAVIAPFAAHAAGAVAEIVLAPAVDRLDDAVDFVDWTADRAVAVWRDVLATFGLMIDVAETGAAIAAEAVDLAGDVAQWVVDGVGEAMSWAAGGAGDLVGSAADWLGL